jgi:eukaryotic-like serine/threonine-protein kinase
MSRCLDRKATVHTPLNPLEPGAQVGRWRVVERLGTGGQGSVYRVEDPEHPGDFYALKLVRPGHEARAERETALMMVQAAHPGVARFHGCSRWPHPRDGVLGLLMDWVPGPPLHRWAEREDVSFRQLVQVGAKVAATLGVLHARGVLHRDLKPEHIVLRESDGHPILLDFGAGWYAGAPPLTTGALPPATLYLLSPEALRFWWSSPQRPGEHYAAQPTDDLYALGVCLYRATTGQDPFPEGWPSDLMQYAIVHQVPHAPLKVNSRVPRALSDLILRLLAKTPEARYPSGAALEEALAAMASRPEAEWDVSVFARDATDPGRACLPSRPRCSWSSFPAPLPPKTRRRNVWPWALGLSAAAVWMLMPGALVSRHALAMSDLDEGWTTDAKVGAAQRRGAEPRPVPNQKLAPCTAKLELELSGACWLSLKQRPPECPPQTVMYEDQCLLPVAASHPTPVSGEGGASQAR